MHALLQARDDMDNTVSKKIYRLDLIQDMRNNSGDMSVAIRNIALLTDTKEKQTELKRIVIQKAQYYANRENLVKSMSLNVSPEGKRGLDNLLKVDDFTIKLLTSAGQNAMKVTQAKTIDYLMKTVRPQQSRMLDALNSLSDIQKQVTNKSVYDARELVSHTVIMMAALVLFSFFIALVVCITTIRTLMRELGGEPALAHQHPGNDDAGACRHDNGRAGKQHQDERGARDRFAALLHGRLAVVLLYISHITESTEKFILHGPDVADEKRHRFLLPVGQAQLAGPVERREGGVHRRSDFIHCRTARRR